MIIFFRGFLVALTLFPLPLAADAVATIDKYRGSFEKRMNAELDEHGKAARDLRVKYLEALRKLKLELGRAENLKGAVQVVAEIEAVEDGEEATELPADADHRFKRLREQWDRGLVGIRRERTKKLNETVKLYFQALDKEKRRLTRAGKIKEALLFEEEENRVKELPEVVAALPQEEPSQKEVNLKRYLPGKHYSYRKEEAPDERLTVVFRKSGAAHFVGLENKTLFWKIKEGRTVVLGHKSWSAQMHLNFAADGNSFEGEAVPLGHWRRGKLLETPD
ncbi:MAG: hypothetical protein CMP28_11440 [Roseibacillus sp.]|nr:hypothetical protein [Roseibacillus sp.]